jgi:hypothetical protein
MQSKGQQGSSHYEKQLCVIRECQKIFVFVNALYEALWQLLNNGRKPVLRRMRYSIKSMKRDRKPKWQSQTVQERMVAEVDDFLKELTCSAQQGFSSR